MHELATAPLTDVTDQEMEALLASLAEGVDDLIDTDRDALPEFRRLDAGERTDDALVEVVPAGWYVSQGEVPSGPLAAEQVRERCEAGELGPDSLCWRPGLADWVPLRQVSFESAAEP